MNEKRDQLKFNAILLSIFFAFVIACTLLGTMAANKKAYIERVPTTCTLNIEEHLCEIR